MLGKKKQPELADDFSQEVALRAWKAGTSKLKLEWCWIDFLRKEKGDPRIKKRQGTLVSMDQGFEENQSLHNLLYSEMEEQYESPGSWRQTIAMLFVSGDEAMILDLYESGLTEETIGRILGVTGFRISQRLGAIRERLKIWSSCYG